MAVTYTLRYRTAAAESAPAGSWVEVTGLTSTSHAVSGLSAGTRYDVEIVAVSDGGTESTPASGARWTVCPRPSAPTGSPAGYLLTSGTDTNGAVDVSWAAVAGAASYTVEHRTTGSGTWSEVTGVAGTSTRLGGLVGSTTHEVRVAAVNADGDTSTVSSATYGLAAVIATGGTVTRLPASGTATHIVHTFDAVGTSVLTLNRSRDLDYLAVGGGGGGGGAIQARQTSGGGGGGGGVAVGTLVGATGSVSVTVGDGGAGAVGTADNQIVFTSDGGNGTATTMSSGGSTVTASGGFGGERGQYTTNGLGGGGRSSGAPTNNGGGSTRVNLHGGGGGGAGAVGQNATYPTPEAPGSGGDGTPSSLSGTATTYGGGGGGGFAGFSQFAVGGAGGGGVGARKSSAAGSGAANSGGGGGGGSPSTTAAYRDGGAGGSGVVVVRYVLPAV